jgi:small subunit ribosomal protein S23
LNNKPNMTVTKAYDIARRKFYKLRHQEDVERRVAEEEATWTGAYFGPTLTERGMEFENAVHDRWKAWAEEEMALFTQKSNSMLGIDSNEIPPGKGLDDAAAEEEEVPVTVLI